MSYRESTHCAFVVQPCHFRSPRELCRTTIARLDTALVEIERKRRIFEPIVVLAGDIAREPGSPTLAVLMREYLVESGFTGPILIAEGGTGTFAEPRVATELVRSSGVKFPGLDQMIVIASGWQLFAALPFWEREASKYEFGLDYRLAPETGGWRTRLFYRLYGLFLRGALGSGFWSRIEPLLYRLFYQRRYTRGFRVNACR